jgi:hypothetical protein
VFYYAKNSGAAIVAGNLLTAELQTAQFTELAVGTLLAGSPTITPTLGATAVTVDEYAGGYCVIIDDTGEGKTYTIKSHPAASGTATCELTLEDPIHVDFGAGTTVQMVKNLWGDVIIAPGGVAHVPVGVSNTAVDAGTSTPQWFWCQTWGVCSVWQDEGATIGQALTSGTTAGQVEVWNVAGDQEIGWNIWLAVAGENQPVFLRIAP